MKEDIFSTLTVPMTVATATPPRPTNADPEDMISYWVNESQVDFSQPHICVLLGYFVLNSE